MIFAYFMHISYRIQWGAEEETECPNLHKRKFRSFMLLTFFMFMNILTQMFTWWSLMCTQLLYWWTNAMQHLAAQPKWMNKEEKRRCKRTLRKYVPHDEHLISSHLYILQWFVICAILYYVPLHHLLLLLLLGCLWQMHFALLWCSTSANDPGGYNSSNFRGKNSKIGLFIFPFSDGNFSICSHTIIFCDILNKRFNSSDMMNDHWILE